MRNVLLCVALLATAPSCKAMGALGHVGHALGHVGHAMSAVGRVAAVSSRALAPVARVAAHVLPTLANIAVASRNVTYVGDVELEVPEGAPSTPGPLIDNGDACGYCPDTLACGACGDANGVACVLTPPGAFARCESQMKLAPPGG